MALYVVAVDETQYQRLVRLYGGQGQEGHNPVFVNAEVDCLYCNDPASYVVQEVPGRKWAGTPGLCDGPDSHRRCLLPLRRHH